MASDCTHKELFFGSGEYYVICASCGHKWTTTDEQERAAPELANNGAGAFLSGQKRVEVK